MSDQDPKPIMELYCKQCGTLVDVVNENKLICPACYSHSLRHLTTEQKEAIKLTDWEIKTMFVDENNNYLQMDSQRQQRALMWEAVRRGFVPCALPANVSVDNVGMSFWAMVKLIFKWVWASIFVAVPFAIFWWIVLLVIASNSRPF